MLCMGVGGWGWGGGGNMFTVGRDGGGELNEFCRFLFPPLSVSVGFCVCGNIEMAGTMRWWEVGMRGECTIKVRSIRKT